MRYPSCKLWLAVSLIIVMTRNAPFLFFLLSCKSLEDEANSGQASQEATNSADEQANDAQPVNDLTLKVERQVFFFADYLMCCICFLGGSFVGFWVGLGFFNKHV